jgi:hypothetical protein
MTRHAEAAYDAADDPARALLSHNPQELLALVEAARASTALAMASERRCSEERAILAALSTKLNDTTHCQLFPAGLGPFQQTRLHVLGQCQHPEFKGARRKAARPGAAVQNPQYLYTEDQRPRGRLPHWRHIFSITADDQWVWPDDEPGINAKSAGWQISHWWGCGDLTAWISGLRTTKTRVTQCLPESGQHCSKQCNSWAGAHSTSAAQSGWFSNDYEQESMLMWRLRPN